MSSTTGDRFLKDYILGRLGEQEAEAVESRYFRDPELLAALEVAADDLADAYVRNKLSADDRSRFEQYCVKSSEDQARLRLAQGLTRLSAASAPKSFFVQLLERVGAYFHGQPAQVGGMVTVAMAVAVVGLSYFGWRLTQVNIELAQLRAETSALAAAAAVAGDAQRLADRERQARESLEGRLASLSTVAFVLTPGQVRGSGVGFEIRPSTSFVRLDLALDAAVDAKRLRITLRSESGSILWSEEVAPGASVRDSLTISTTVPAALLAPGAYQVVLEDRSTLARATELATYLLQITQP